jgi:2',3'-cyclic-nucleotide 2'-phosphodiesterase/3'-nucleotidase
MNPMALCLEYIGYDAAVIGNHEFNYSWNTMNTIRAHLASKGVSSVCANLYYADTGENVFTPYITKTITVSGQEYKIGVLGLENTDCTRWDVPDNYPNIIFASKENTTMSMAYEVNKYVPQMKAAGCDFIIVSYHSGLGTTSGDLVFGENTENQVMRMISETNGVDMVIAGHDHSSSYSNNNYKNKDGKDVLVVNGGGTQLTQSVWTASVDSEGKVLRFAERIQESYAFKLYRGYDALSYHSALCQYSQCLCQPGMRAGDRHLGRKD